MRLAIVGGGAAGLAAALAASEDRRLRGQIDIFERQEQLGRKLAASGNGRCNLGHSAVSSADYVSADKRGLEPFLNNYSEPRMQKYWRRLGVPLKVDSEGRWYPQSEEAKALRNWLQVILEERGVRFHFSEAVRALRTRSAGGFHLKTEQAIYDSECCILCAGSPAAPQLGGVIDGLDLAVQLGLTAQAFAPSLVPVYTNSAVKGQAVAGQKLKGRATLRQGKDILARSEGEFMLNEKGLSGIAVMELMMRAGYSLRLREENQSWCCCGSPSLHLDLYPDWQEEMLGKLLEQRRKLYPSEPWDTVLRYKVGQAFAKARLLTPNAAPRILAGQLKDLTFAVEAVGSWAEAQTARGGLILSQFSELTWESLAHPGFYAAGELLDVAGNTGGYNLYFAFASGDAAGRAAAQKLTSRA